MSNQQDEFCRNIRKHLGSLALEFDNELTLFLQQRFPPETAFLFVEYDSQHFIDDFSTGVFAMDRRGEFVGLGHWFIKSDTAAIPLALDKLAENEEVESFAELALTVFEDWLIERWNHQSVARFPAFVGHHDSFFVRNMTDNSETTWAEIINDAKR